MAIATSTIDPIAAVRRALSDAPDRQGATSILVQRLNGNAELRAAFIARFRPTLIEDIAADAIREVAGSERHIARHLAKIEEIDGRGLVSRVGKLKDALSRWTLPSGVFLKRATREELVEAAEFVESQARSLMAIGRQYRAIAKRLEPGQVVGDVLDDEALAKFFDQG